MKAAAARPRFLNCRSFAYASYFTYALLVVKPSHAILFIVLVGCQHREALPSHQSLPRFGVRLVDTLDRSEGQDAPYFRIEVKGPTTDTLSEVWTIDQPTIVGDSLVVWTLADTATNRTAFFQYFVVPRRLERLAMPGQFGNPLSDLRISPDGKLFTWAAFDGNGHAAAEIHRFPSAELVSRSLVTRVSPSDGRLGIGEWLSPVEARVAIWASVDTARPWIRFRHGPTQGTWTVDTVRNGQ